MYGGRRVHEARRLRGQVQDETLGTMTNRSLNLLREALSNLAAEATVQRQRFAGAVVTDELALDFENALVSVTSSYPEIAMNDVALLWLENLRDLLSVGSSNSLWTEDLGSPTWSHIRMLAAMALVEL
jgi:hypothetical protein